jgi:glucokinase
MYSAMLIGCQYYRFPTLRRPLIFPKSTVMLAHDMTRIPDNWLIADIGATTSRCALLSEGNFRDIRLFINDDTAGPREMLTTFIDEATSTPTGCALAVAAPIDGDDIQMINRDWQFSRAWLSELGFERIEIINDFHAIAHALPTLSDESRIEIGRATRYRQGNIAVLGPGSGLGMAAWIAGTAAMSGEGGHITMSGRNASEDSIIAALRDRYGHCSAERVLSGPGLTALHEVMHGTAVATSEEITMNPDDPANAATMQQFFRFLGSVAAELALITGAAGGVYIAGGIVPACLEQIVSSEFRSRFEDKNRYRDFMRAIPTWVITDPYPGLSGLAAYINQGSRVP